VTGSTGYVGSRLIPELLRRNVKVRAMARTPAKLDDVPWRRDVEVVRGDLTEPATLAEAFDGVDVVYYLAHAMGTSDDFATAERDAATNVADAAAQAGVARIVYLSGLHPDGAELSRHLASRTAVGEILIDSGVPTVVLQAGVVVGSGSASFEMIRHLTDRLPVMTTPRWVHNTIQPIAVSDVLHYLAESATAEIGSSRTWDIGGPDVLEYGDMMQIYAEVAGLHRRRILVLPFLTPTIASWWVGLVTPIPAGLARPLVESLHCDAVAGEHDIDGIIAAPKGGLTPYRAAVADALEHLRHGEFDAVWDGDAAAPYPSDPDWAGQRVYGDTVRLQTRLDPDTVRTRLAAAPRLSRYDTSGERLRFRAGFDAVPGTAWLDVRLSPGSVGGSRIEQRATLAPRGLAGRLYAATVWPLKRKRLYRKVSEVIEAM
jgi:uncharacterized protein YbjT (DUF2867 family)